MDVKKVAMALPAITQTTEGNKNQTPPQTNRSTIKSIKPSDSSCCLLSLLYCLWNCLLKCLCCGCFSSNKKNKPVQPIDTDRPQSTSEDPNAKLVAKKKRKKELNVDVPSSTSSVSSTPSTRSNTPPDATPRNGSSDPLMSPRMKRKDNTFSFYPKGHDEAALRVETNDKENTFKIIFYNKDLTEEAKKEAILMLFVYATKPTNKLVAVDKSIVPDSDIKFFEAEFKKVFSNEEAIFMAPKIK